VTVRPRLLATTALLLVSALGASVGCRARGDQRSPPKDDTPKVVYHTLGTWSGRGNKQTESFTSDTGTLRVTWEATALGDGGDSVPGPSRVRPSPVPPFFALDAHSAISGRLLQTVVDKGGPGRGVGYVQQDPHVFYMVVESAGVDWKFTVEEAIGYP
jgi:hypothetical protein